MVCLTNLTVWNWGWQPLVKGRFNVFNFTWSWHDNITSSSLISHKLGNSSRHAVQFWLSYVLWKWSVNHLLHEHLSKCWAYHLDLLFLSKLTTNICNPFYSLYWPLLRYSSVGKVFEKKKGERRLYTRLRAQSMSATREATHVFMFWG